MCSSRSWRAVYVLDFILHKCAKCGYTRVVNFRCPSCGNYDALEMLHYREDTKAFHCRRCGAIVSTLEDYEENVQPLIAC